VTFPSSVVNRITPVAAKDELAEVRASTGLADLFPVLCEPFRQFVVEDNLAAGRPNWEVVGVQMVPDVQPYEQLKLRLLNASHQLLGHFGLLLGYSYTSEAMADPQLAALLATFQAREATPTLPEVPGVDVADYARTVRERFANPQMADTLVRIVTSASARVPAFVLPVVRNRLSRGEPSPISAATVAAWLHRRRDRRRSRCSTRTPSCRPAPRPPCGRSWPTRSSVAWRPSHCSSRPWRRRPRRWSGPEQRP
jgi:mannitol 2-dehydrogenase